MRPPPGAECKARRRTSQPATDRPRGEARGVTRRSAVCRRANARVRAMRARGRPSSGASPRTAREPARRSHGPGGDETSVGFTQRVRRPHHPDSDSTEPTRARRSQVPAIGFGTAAPHRRPPIFPVPETPVTRTRMRRDGRRRRSRHGCREAPRPSVVLGGGSCPGLGILWACSAVIPLAGWGGFGRHPRLVDAGSWCRSVATGRGRRFGACRGRVRGGRVGVCVRDRGVRR